MSKNYRKCIYCGTRTVNSTSICAGCYPKIKSIRTIKKMLQPAFDRKHNKDMQTNTNYAKIKNMSVEEMACFLLEDIFADNCRNEVLIRGKWINDTDECVAWLESEAEE